NPAGSTPESGSAKNVAAPTAPSTEAVPVLAAVGPLPDLKGQVILRMRTEGKPAEIRFTPSQKMREAAMQWSYVLRNRRRWANNDEVRREQQRDLTALLVEQGVDRN